MKTYTIKPLDFKPIISKRKKIIVWGAEGGWSVLPWRKTWCYTWVGIPYKPCKSAMQGKQLCQAEHERRLMEFLSPVEKASQP